METFISLAIMAGLFFAWCALGAAKKMRAANRLAQALPGDAAQQFLFFDNAGHKEFALGNLQLSLLRKGQALAVLSAKRVINESDSALIPFFCLPSYTEGMSKPELQELIDTVERLKNKA